MSEDHAVEMNPIGEGGRISYVHREGYEATPDDPRIEGLSEERAEQLVATGIFEHADSDSDGEADDATEDGSEGNGSDDAGEGDESPEENDFTALEHVGDATAASLKSAGHETFEDLRNTEQMELASVTNVSESLAEDIHGQLAGNAESVPDESEE